MSRCYQHILVAVDFMPDRPQVTDRALQLAQQCGARLSLVHVVEYFPMDMANELALPQDVELEGQLIDTAKQKLNSIANELAIDQVSVFVELGQTSREVIRIAEQQQADLILVGSHGRHGFSRILGSTANAIMHHAPCDVLSVRIQPTNGAAS